VTELNGPSCSGPMLGDVVRRQVKAATSSFRQAPHGWTDIPDHVDYLSFRPSRKC
jgi:hypothetical protein